MEIRNGRQAVQLVGRVQLFLAADMEQDGDARLLRHRPHRVEPDMAGRMTPGAFRRNHQRLCAKRDGRLRAGGCPRDIFKRNLRRWQQAAIDLAEVGHHPVVGVGRRVAQLHVVALIEPEIAEAPGSEDELAGEPQRIERRRPIVREKGALSFVVLAKQDVRFGAGAKRRVGLRRPCLIGLRLPRGPVVIPGEGAIAGQKARLEIGIEAVGQFHQVAVRVVDYPPFDIGHGVLPVVVSDFSKVSHAIPREARGAIRRP